MSLFHWVTKCRQIIQHTKSSWIFKWLETGPPLQLLISFFYSSHFCSAWFMLKGSVMPILSCKHLTALIFQVWGRPYFWRKETTQNNQWWHFTGPISSVQSSEGQVQAKNSLDILTSLAGKCWPDLGTLACGQRPKVEPDTLKSKRFSWILQNCARTPWNSLGEYTHCTPADRHTSLSSIQILQPLTVG